MMNLREYLSERTVEENIIKQFMRVSGETDVRFFSREEAEQFVNYAFGYIERHNLTAELMRLDKRTISQIVFRIASRPADEYVWQIQQDLGLAGKFDTPDGSIWYYSKETEDIGERRTLLAISIEIAKRRGTSPLW